MCLASHVFIDFSLILIFFCFFFRFFEEFHKKIKLNQKKTFKIKEKRTTSKKIGQYRRTADTSPLFTSPLSWLLTLKSAKKRQYSSIFVNIRQYSSIFVNIDFWKKSIFVNRQYSSILTLKMSIRFVNVDLKNVKIEFVKTIICKHWCEKRQHWLPNKNWYCLGKTNANHYFWW